MMMPLEYLWKVCQSGMAEYYSAELSQKVDRNMRLNAMKGYFNGGFAPLGYKVVTVDCGSYKKKRLEVDPITSEVVKEIFKLLFKFFNYSIYLSKKFF